MPDHTNPQSLNRYTYVGNNPVTFNDPSGRCFDVCPPGFGTDVSAKAQRLEEAISLLPGDRLSATQEFGFVVPGFGADLPEFSGQLQFQAWMTTSGRLGERTGSRWWKAANGSMILDIQAAQSALSGGDRATASDPNVLAWLEYRALVDGGADASTRQAAYWRVHQMSLHTGIDAAVGLLGAETLNEQVFINQVVENVDLSALFNYSSSGLRRCKSSWATSTRRSIRQGQMRDCQWPGFFSARTTKPTPSEAASSGWTARSIGAGLARLTSGLAALVAGAVLGAGCAGSAAPTAGVSEEGTIALGTVIGVAVSDDTIAAIGTAESGALEFKVVLQPIAGSGDESEIVVADFAGVWRAALTYTDDGRLITLASSITTQRLSIIEIFADGSSSVLADLGDNRVALGQIAVRGDDVLAGLHPSGGSPVDASLYAISMTSGSVTELLSVEPGIFGVVGFDGGWMLSTGFPMSLTQDANGELAWTDLSGGDVEPVAFPRIVPVAMAASLSDATVAIMGFDPENRDLTSAWTLDAGRAASEVVASDWRLVSERPATAMAMSNDYLLLVDQGQPASPATFNLIPVS